MFDGTISTNVGFHNQGRYKRTCFIFLSSNNSVFDVKDVNFMFYFFFFFLFTNKCHWMVGTIVRVRKQQWTIIGIKTRGQQR